MAGSSVAMFRFAKQGCARTVTHSDARMERGRLLIYAVRKVVWPCGLERTVIGRTGRITGRVAPGAVGEVTLQIRGGSEAFYAYASVNGAVIDKGVKVKVDDYQPPLTVFVSPVDPAPGTQDFVARSAIQDTVRSRPIHHSYT
jgi:hypothetical protein